MGRTQQSRGTADNAGRILLLVAAIAAAAAATGGAVSLGDADADSLIVETWRVAGLGVFAGLFGLLAYRPRHPAGVWVLAIANTVALTAAAATAATGTADSGITAVSDGALSVLLVAAYVLTRGWRAWRSPGLARARNLS